MSDELFAAVVAHTAVRKQTDDAAIVAALLRIEAALATVQERVGDLDPAAAAAAREACASAADADLADLARDTALGGNPVIPLVAELKRLAGPHEDAVHRGATSQDVLDTALMLMSRDSIGTIVTDLERAVSSLGDLAVGDQLVMGRTLMQSAVPLPLSVKVGGWRRGLAESADRLRAVAIGLPVQLGGPVGDGSTLGERHEDIRAGLAEQLGLADTPGWHTMRLPIADLASALATASGVVGKVALDVVLMAQTELAEVREVAEGRGGSSSMPHKSNPIAAISARASARRAPHLAAHLFAQMEQEHERAAGAWHAEWSVLVDLLRATGSASWWIAESLGSLEIDPEAMGRHL
jgi:3-carboxy-cis,cis-muconate cycloisomerase